MVFAHGLPSIMMSRPPAEELSAAAEAAAGFSELCNLGQLWWSICTSRSQQITETPQPCTSINIVLIIQKSCISAAAVGSRTEQSTSICTSLLLSLQNKDCKLYYSNDARKLEPQSSQSTSRSAIQFKKSWLKRDKDIWTLNRSKLVDLFNLTQQFIQLFTSLHDVLSMPHFVERVCYCLLRVKAIAIRNPWQVLFDDSGQTFLIHFPFKLDISCTDI